MRPCEQPMKALYFFSGRSEGCADPLCSIYLEEGNEWRVCSAAPWSKIGILRKINDPLMLCSACSLTSPVNYLFGFGEMNFLL